jgi:hypothetical protein
LLVVNHGKIGLVLVAARPLPRLYYTCWFGKLTKSKDAPSTAAEWALETTKGGVINARRHKEGSKLQFCACAGPDELVSVAFAHDPERFLPKKIPAAGTLAGVLFVTTKELGKGHQLVMTYGEKQSDSKSFLEDRGVEWGNAGTDAHPVALRDGATGVVWDNAESRDALASNGRSLEKKLRLER